MQKSLAGGTGALTDEACLLAKASHVPTSYRTGFSRKRAIGGQGLPCISTPVSRCVWKGCETPSPAFRTVTKQKQQAGLTPHDISLTLCQVSAWFTVYSVSLYSTS